MAGAFERDGSAAIRGFGTRGAVGNLEIRGVVRSARVPHDEAETGLGASGPDPPRSRLSRDSGPIHRTIGRFHPAVIIEVPSLTAIDEYCLASA